MPYLVLARKSRPQCFEEVVGQQPVVRTLRNALAQNRVAHALIFSGIRGTGKTTLARIMAKALNCEQGPTPTPCNSCLSCREIAAGGSVDLLEIDGASNRGIQEIRELKEKIRFMPVSSRYKIVIIDEVHMLTNEAFNGLLKTLEEPPAHVYFMFATTELHKVPVTILSRCQRYELKRVAHRELVAHFGRLARQEGVAMEEEALHLVAREAAGSVRDGLSLLDQVFSYGGDQVLASDVIEILGLVSHQVIGELGDSLLQGNLARALELLDGMYGVGMHQQRFMTDLLAWCRGLVVCKVSRNPGDLLDMPTEELRRLQQTASQYPLPTLVNLFNLLLEEFEQVSFSSHTRFTLEMALIRAVQAGDVVPVSELIGRFDRLLQETAAPTPGEMQPEEDRRQPAPVAAGEHRRQPDDAATGSGTAPVQVEKTTRPPDRAVSRNEVPAAATPKPRKLTEKRIRLKWDDFVAYVRERKIWMATILQQVASIKGGQERLDLLFADGSDCGLLQSRQHLDQLAEYVLDFFQQPLSVHVRVDSGGQEDGAASTESPIQQRKALANDPLVLAAVEIFNGQVGDIRIGPRFRGSTSQGKSGQS